MSWLDVVIPLVLGLALLAVPGGLVSLALGLRGLLMAAVAPLVTVTLSAVFAVLLPFVSIGWSPLALLAASVACSAVVVAARRLAAVPAMAPAQHPNRTLTQRLWVAAGFVTGAVLILVQLALVFGKPGSISQTFDNVFHLNGVRYILDTGSASSLTMSGMASGDQPPYFYPAAWHGLAAALVQLSGAPLPVAVNALNMAVACLVWPLGSMLLTRVVAGNNAVAVGAAGVLSAAFSAFPIMLLDFGVLYPNFLSIAMLPAALSSVVLFFNPTRISALPRPVRYSLPLFLAPGLALAHPNGLMSLLVLAVPVVLHAYIVRYYVRSKIRTNRREWRWATWSLTAGALALLGLWVVIRPPRDAAFWGPTQSPAGAVFEVATNSAMNRPVAATVSVLMIIGLVVSRRHLERLWMIGCFLVISFLFLVVSGIPTSFIRSVITGVWYNDSYRLAALLPLAALPFAAVGVDAVAGWSCRLVTRSSAAAGRRWLPQTRPVAFIALALAACAGVAGLIPPIAGAIETARMNYVENPDSPLLSTDEQRVIDQLHGVVPYGAVIAVNPWTGGALAYALADRDTTAKHILTNNTRDVELLNQRLRDADQDPAVCAAAHNAGVKYVLDFGTKEVHGGDHRFPGLENLQASKSVKLLVQEGEARLYELTDCRVS